MGEATPGEWGQWDRDGHNALFDKYRAAAEGVRVLGRDGTYKWVGGAHRRRLADQLIQANRPLIKTLVAQVRGRTLPGRPVRTAMRLIGAELLEWDEAMNLGRYAFSKAIDTFDPAQGKISGSLLRKIFY